MSSFVSLTAGPGFEEVDDEALAEMCLVVEDASPAMA